MKTVYEVKQALNPDLYVNLVREWQAPAEVKRDKPSRRKRNKWGELSPLCKTGK